MSRSTRKIDTYINQKKRYRELFFALTPFLPFPTDGGHDLLHLKICSFVGKEMPSRCIRTLEGHTKPVCSLAVLNDDTIVSGSCDSTIKLWNSKTGECIRTLKGHLFQIWALTVLSDDTIVSGSADNTIKLWNRDGRCIYTLEGHGHPVYSLTVLSDNTIVSGSVDMTIKLWN